MPASLVEPPNAFAYLACHRWIDREAAVGLPSGNRVSTGRNRGPSIEWTGMDTKSVQRRQLEPTRALPKGLVYIPDGINFEEEAALLRVIGSLPFSEAQYREFTARRRIVSFGGRYDFTNRQLSAAPPIPEFLLPIRAHVASRLGVEAERLTHGLVTEYQPGTPIGWHRDAPAFEFTIGISLLGLCRMRLRPYVYSPRKAARRTARSRADTVTLLLEPRSIYLIRDDARWRWQHSIPPVPELRYSITFRALSESTARSEESDLLWEKPTVGLDRTRGVQTRNPRWRAEDELRFGVAPALREIASPKRAFRKRTTPKS